MAASLTSAYQGVFGDRRVAIVDVAFDDSYPTGGEAVDLSEVGIGTVLFAIVEPTDGYTFEYDRSNDKVVAYWVDTTTDGAPQAEVANTTDLDGVVARAFVVGSI